MIAAAQTSDGADLLGGLLFAVLVITAFRVAWWAIRNGRTDGYWTYEIDTDEGSLLYVGSTDDPGKRMHRHEQFQRRLPDGHPRKWWENAEEKVRRNYWPSRAKWWRSKALALEAERRAIRERRPLANVIRYKGIPAGGDS